MYSKYRYITPFFIAASLSSIPSYGESEDKEASASLLENIVVMGTRQAYRGDFDPFDVPQAELVIDSKVLRNAGAVSLDQALDLSASVARQNNFGGLWNSFAVRGFVGDENLPSNYLVNGFNAGRGFGGARDLSGIESVEVLKGPRAALYGRGEPGGTINLVTKRPTFESAGEVRFSVGSFDTYRTDVDWTTPVSDTAAVRLVGFYEDADSFRDTVETRKRGASPSLAWRMSEQSQLIYELEYSYQEVPFDRGVVAIDGKLGRILESRFLGEPGDGPMEAEVLGHQLEFQHNFNEDWSALIGFNYRDTSLEGFATEPELSSSRQFLYVDGESLSRFRRYRDYDATYEVFRAEISGRFETGELLHRVIIGVDEDEFENDQVFLRARGPSIGSGGTFEELQVINVFNPMYGQYPLPEPGANTDRVETQESIGFFVQDQISLTENLDIRLGARYDDYQQELNNRASGTVSKQSETQLSPQFGIVYQATDAISIYAAYGENFRPLSGTDAKGNGFDPNQSTSIEVGVKFALNDGALVGTISAFKIEQDNILVVDDPGAFTLAAIGEAESQGLEIDLNGEIADGLSLWASYTYIDTETKNDFYDANFGRTVSAGSPLLNVPEQQLSLQLVKQTQLAGKPLELGGGVLYVGERNGYFGVDFDLPSYTTARLFTAYQLTKELSLRAEVDNLFDEEYYSNSFADVWVQPGTPRSMRVSAAFRF
ncbi:MAG: TonB-dependent siderophore receptor [Gammaproteobacteria bacterium]|nr:TonB-dependent siderophore receptor [Gammaproteobacteria bacterium]